MFGNNNFINFLVALLYVIIVGHYGTSYIVQKMWSILRIETGKKKKDLKSRVWQAKVIGVIDRILFLTALLMEKPEFIAIWMSLKTVSQYKRWSEDEPGRATFNIFLTGNGLSILYAVASYGFIKFWDDKLVSLSLLLMPIILSAVMFFELKREERNATPD